MKLTPGELKHTPSLKNNAQKNVTTENNYSKYNQNVTQPITLSTLLIISVSVVLSAIILQELRNIKLSNQEITSARTETALPQCKQEDKRPVYWVYGRNVDSGYLKHVFLVLDRLGYRRGTNKSEWDFLWSHDYPFRTLHSQLYDLKPHQKVNHIPGCGYITNKVDLSTTKIKNIPISFKLPEDKQTFLEYSKKYPNKLFIQKSNAHRGIKIEQVSTLDLNSTENFIQEYVDKPFLVDGYKFDIGVYTIITSVNPLRLYVYNGDVLFRYCPVKYYPFDPEVLDKYVVGDDYLPTWKVPSLQKWYNELGFSMKDSFDAYVRSKGKNPNKVWDEINDTIRNIALQKEKLMAAILKRFKSNVHNFFEMVRFDFVLDENLDVYVMEANMSPNLSSAHYPPNQLLYEQVIFNTLALVGLANRVRKPSLAVRNRAEEKMETADKNFVVYPNDCSSRTCESDCSSSQCYLCLPCLSEEQKLILTNSYKEYLNRGDCKRIFPPSMDSKHLDEKYLNSLSEENQWLYRWFYGKCLLDEQWC